MKTEAIKEPFAISHVTVYDDELGIRWSDLKTANIGTVWSIDDQDRYPNRTREWTVSFTLIYRDETGCAVKHYEDDPNGEVLELLWFEFN